MTTAKALGWWAAALIGAYILRALYVNGEPGWAIGLGSVIAFSVINHRHNTQIDKLYEVEDRYREAAYQRAVLDGIYGTAALAVGGFAAVLLAIKG